MSATIPDTMPLEEITKATGYDCPEDLQGVTFKEATSGQGGGASVSDVQINGTSIVDGSTKIANIQPKATINDTATENDIPSAKGVLDLFNSGSGTTEVKVDGVTVEKLTGSKLQANAIIPVTDLPTSDIKQKSIYQKQDGEFIKNYIYVNNKWQSVSVINLTEEKYNNLTNTQKTDGTLYIVSDTTNPAITWNYSALDNKPIINGVTIDGRLTLEDLQLYSKNEVNNLLAQKGNALFVDELPTEMQPLYWYYSKKKQDGTPVVDDKRALYIKDGNGVVQYMGITGDVDLANYYTIEQANNTFVSKAEFNGNDLFDASKFLMADEFGGEATSKIVGKVFKILNNLYAISLNIGFYDKPQVNTRVSYNARFILNDGTNLLDRELLFNRPISLYDTNGNVVGSMILGKDKIFFYFTTSTNEYFCNGLLFRF